MGDPKGFLKIQRKTAGYRPVCERVKDYREVAVMREDEDSRVQASRCMDCGTPFCHWGCPLANYIPEWNDLMFKEKWEKAFQILQATNNFPEFTGRICPAICEYACILGINDDPVTIKENELAIIEYAFKKGLVKPDVPRERTGRKVAVVGSGPAGLACAVQLNKAGHNVTVYEKADRPGGILRYGIPDYKLDKRVIDRRISLMKDSGIEFQTGINAGGDIPAGELLEKYDAICLTGGSRVPRDLNIEGRELSGIHFAMEYLVQSNRRVAGDKVAESDIISAKGKKVVVIGGGDTGADCVGTAHRQGASCVVQIEVMPKPSETRSEEYPWPIYPMLLKTTSSHEEGGERKWSVLTKKFTGTEGSVDKLLCVEVEFERDKNGRPAMKEIPESGFEIDAELVLLAVGFVHPEHEGLVNELGVELDARGNVKTGNTCATSVEKVFSAGDMRRGQSLVVWAISEGRRAAHNIDKYLMKESELPAV